MGTQKGAGARMYYVRRVSEGVVEQGRVGREFKVRQSTPVLSSAYLLPF